MVLMLKIVGIKREETMTVYILNRIVLKGLYLYIRYLEDRVPSGYSKEVYVERLNYLGIFRD